MTQKYGAIIVIVISRCVPISRPSALDVHPVLECMMGFYFEDIKDDPKAQDLRFRCHCGGTEPVRVTVPKPGGSMYVTEFAKCRDCSAMFHWAGSFEYRRWKIPEAPDRAARIAGYGKPHTPVQDGLEGPTSHDLAKTKG